MKTLQFLVRFEWALVLACVFAGASLAEGPSGSEKKPLIVQIHADWCSTCKKLEPTWARILDEFSRRSHTVRLDVSDRESYEASLEIARDFEIEDFFREHRRKTGTIAVLGCNSHDPPVFLRGEINLEEYRQALVSAESRC